MPDGDSLVFGIAGEKPSEGTAHGTPHAFLGRSRRSLLPATATEFFSAHLAHDLLGVVLP